MRFLLALIYSGALLLGQRNQLDWNTQIKNRPGALIYNSPTYNFLAQSPGGSIIIGSNTKTLAPVPPGINGTDSVHTLWISGGTGTAEACLITGGTAVAAATTGTVVMTCANTHSGAWTVTSASAGIEEAVIAAQAAGGGIITIPPGTYTVNSPITVTSTGTYLQGAGPAATTLTCTGTSTDCVDFTGAVTSGIRDLSIVGSGKSSGWAINCSSAGRILIEDIRIASVPNGVQLYLVTVAYVNRVNITDTPSGYGIEVYGGSDQHISNIVHDNSGTLAFAGINISATGGAMLTNLDMIHCTHGLLVNPVDGTNVIALEVHHAWFDTGTNGITILPAGAGGGGAAAVTDFRCTDCWTVSNTLVGTSVGGTVQDINFIGLVSFGNGREGFLMGGGSVNILDSTIAANSTSSSGTYNNVTVGANVSDFRIQNSTLGGAYYTIAETAGYSLAMSGTSTRFIVSGNTINAGTVGRMTDAATGTAGFVNNNLGVNPQGASTVTFGSSPWTYRAGHSPEVVTFVGGTCTSISRAGAVPLATSTTAAVSAYVPANGTVVATCSVGPTVYKDIQ